MALSMDLREKVMKAIPGGMSRRQAAARFEIGRSQRIEAHADLILAQIKEKPDMIIMELRNTIRRRKGLAAGYGTMWRFLARHRITRKKKIGSCLGAGRGGCRRAREEWFEGQLDLDPERLVFIDETNVSTNMARRFGRALRGER